MRKDLIKKLKLAAEKTSIMAESKRLKVPYTTVYRMIHEKGGCTLSTWEKIEKGFPS